MTSSASNTINRVFAKSFKFTKACDPVQTFHSDQYLRRNARRLEHLASLRIPVSGKSVLEAGAGIGDHSHYFIDRNCSVTITEAREENLNVLRHRYPNCNVQHLDMENPSALVNSPFDIVYCYGLLYHLETPKQALQFLANCTQQTLLVETCVSFGDSDDVNLIAEKQQVASQAVSGTGCRPTRGWLFGELKSLFEYVYFPKTQPNHEQFPLNWSDAQLHQAKLARAVFIASSVPIDNE